MNKYVACQLFEQNKTQSIHANTDMFINNLSHKLLCVFQEDMNMNQLSRPDMIKWKETKNLLLISKISVTIRSMGQISEVLSQKK